MKYITNILRVFVGLLFIFSGLIKSNDPTGFSYKLDEYFSVFAEELEADQDS
ncbi:DoxX family protein, partial [Bacteroidia bacterium]|nr:DoxX family protein [Bacteroidia bacterium]